MKILARRNQVVVTHLTHFKIQPPPTPPLVRRGVHTTGTARIPPMPLS